MGNKRSKVYHRTVLTDNEISILEAKTGLSRQEIQAWHSQFLVRVKIYSNIITEFNIELLLNYPAR